MSEWKKVKIGEICQIIKGTTGIASAKPGEYPLVVTALERKTCSSFQFDCEAVCIPLVSSSGHGKKSLNNVHYQKGRFALGTILCAVIPNNPNELDARFLHQYLQFYKDKILVPLMKGAANVSLSMKDIAKVEIPLPSIEKQHKLSELFVETQKKYKKLLEESENQKSYIKLLRQNIFQEAIEGKLTEEWRKTATIEESGKQFLDHIIEERNAKLFTEWEEAKKKNPKAKKPPKIVASEIDGEKALFEIPESWCWCRIDDIFAHNSGKALNKSESKEGTELEYITTSNLYWNYFELDNLKTMLFKDSEIEKCTVKKGDFLVCEGGEVGRSAIWTFDRTICIQNHIHRLRAYESKLNILFYYYVMYLFKVSKVIDNYAKGIGIKGLSSNALGSIIVPLPPLAEQKEIVSRVEKLLANVTELEKQITEREEMTKQLMQSIMKDAFREV